MAEQKGRFYCSQEDCTESFRQTQREVDNGWLPNGWRYSRNRNLLCKTCSEYHSQGEGGDGNMKTIQLEQFAERGRIECGHCQKETVAVLKSKKGLYRCGTCAIEQWAGDLTTKPQYWMDLLERHAKAVRARMEAREFHDPEHDVRGKLIEMTPEYRNSVGQGPEAMALMFHLARVINRYLDSTE